MSRACKTRCKSHPRNMYGHHTHIHMTLVPHHGSHVQTPTPRCSVSVTVLTSTRKSPRALLPAPPSHAHLVAHMCQRRTEIPPWFTHVTEHTNTPHESPWFAVHETSTCCVDAELHSVSYARDMLQSVETLQTTSRLGRPRRCSGIVTYHTYESMSNM